MSQLRTVLALQVLNSFVSGILMVAVPLMMEKRNIDVVMMGLVFAAMPLIMQISRMFFATFSDFWGRKLFFVSNGLLGVVSGAIYYLARTPLEFLLGKVTEGTKEGTLWAVNRAFVMENSERKLRALVNLRTVVYIAYAVGSLVVGFLAVWFSFEGTMLLCAAVGAIVFFLALSLAVERKERFSVEKALHFLDFRKKDRIFKVFLILFLVMGLSFGAIGGFVIPLFLDLKGFSAEAIGLILGVQILLAGLFSYVFSKSVKLRRLILLSGVLFSITFFLLGFSDPTLAVGFMLGYGVIEGVAAIGQEGILSRIADRESYGTDIGLLWMGFHVGESLSLALAGFLVSVWGFVAPFLLAASTYIVFSVGAYLTLKE